MKSHSRSLIGAMLVSITTLTACSEQQMQTMMNDLRSGGAASGPLIMDECSRFREPFQQVSAERRARLQQYAQAGAAIGAAAGAATSDGSLQDALMRTVIGGIGGAMIGAASGYYMSLQERTSTRAQLQSAVNGDARGDLARVNGLTRSLVDLNGCRTSQIAEVTNSVATGSLSREQGAQRLRTIRTATLQDDRIVRDTTGQINETNGVYVNALSEAGVRDEASYVAQIERYTPRVTRPRLTAASAGSSVEGSLSVASRAPRSSDPVVQLGFSQRELSATQQANADTLDSMLDEAEALLASI